MIFYFNIIYFFDQTFIFSIINPVLQKSLQYDNLILGYDQLERYYHLTHPLKKKNEKINPKILYWLCILLQNISILNKCCSI